jgi:hypothetical protein
LGKGKRKKKEEALCCEMRRVFSYSALETEEKKKDARTAHPVEPKPRLFLDVLLFETADSSRLEAEKR